MCTDSRALLRAKWIGDFGASIIERQAIGTLGDRVAMPLGGFAGTVQFDSSRFTRSSFIVNPAI